MASSSSGASCPKPSKGVFRTQSYIKDGAFVKIVGGCIFAKELHFRCFWLNMHLPSIRKSLPKCNFYTYCPKFSINILAYFLKSIVLKLLLTVTQFHISHFIFLKKIQIFKKSLIAESLLLRLAVTFSGNLYIKRAIY